MNSFANNDKEHLSMLINEVYDALGCKDVLTKEFIDVALVAIKVFDHKQQRYGPKNIAAFGEYGIMVRTHDKMARLINLIKSNQEPQDETRDDTWGDLAVYSLISLLCRWGRWPGVDGAKKQEALV